jgi:hypothetical protein
LDLINSVKQYEHTLGIGGIALPFFTSALDGSKMLASLSGTEAQLIVGLGAEWAPEPVWMLLKIGINL